MRGESVRQSGVVAVEAVDNELVNIDPRIALRLVPRFAMPANDVHGHLVIAVGEIVLCK